MRIINTICYNVDENLKSSVIEAAKLFYEGKVFIYPTDTIYGFGSNPYNNDAVNAITEIKRREMGKKYIILINDIETLLRHVQLTHESHIDFLLSIWPNPISVVLKLNSSSAKLTGYDDAAFRIPNNRFCLKLLKELNLPLISTSVNRADNPPINDYKMIYQEFKDEVDAIFYTEKVNKNISSTVIDLRGDIPILLREGRINFEEILKKYQLIISE